MKYRFKGYTSVGFSWHHRPNILDGSTLPAKQWATKVAFAISKTIFKLTLVAAGFFCTSHGYAQMNKPAHLRTSLLEHTAQVWQNGAAVTIGLEKAIQQKEQYQYAVIAEDNPVFNWQVSSSVSAYRLLLASSTNLLLQSKPDYWDSKKINSIQSRAVYAGKALEPGKIYYWQVQVWDKQGKASAFSAPAAFYFNPADSISHYPLVAEWQKPAMLKQTSGNYFADFGKDGFGQIRLQLTVTKEDSLIAEVGELANNDFTVANQTRSNIRYTTIKLAVKPGQSTYTIVWPADAKRNSRNPVQMPAYIGEVYPFRYAAVKNNPAFKVNSIERRMVHYPFNDEASSFSCSDTVITKIWELCKYSMKATSFIGYYVDGDRERLPYEADALINQLSHYSSDAEYSIARRSMSYLLYHPTWPTEWSLQNILLAWNDYMYTGDESYLKKYYKELQLKTLMPLAGTNGLISTRTGLQTDAFLQALHKMDFDGRRGLHDIIDWPQTGVAGDEKEYGGETDGFVFNTYNAVINAFYYRNLVLMEKIASLLQQNEDASMYAGKAKQVYDSYQQIFVDVKTGLVKDGDSTSHSSLHSNMMALDFDLVSPEHVVAVLAHIKTRKMACSVYGAQFLMESLYDYNAEDYAQSLLNATTVRSWYNMLRVGSTISMEAWDKMYKPNLDLNHAWGAVPANIIMRKLMGIEPLTPGFEHILIRPQPGNLQWAKCKTPTIRGEVEISYTSNTQQDIWEITLPGGSETSVEVPAKEGKVNLTIDGKPLLLQAKNGFCAIWHAATPGAGRHKIIISK